MVAKTIWDAFWTTSLEVWLVWLGVRFLSPPTREEEA